MSKVDEMISQYERILPLFDYARFSSGDVKPTVNDSSSLQEVFSDLIDFRLKLEEYDGMGEVKAALDACKIDRQAALLKSKLVFALVNHSPDSFDEEAALNPDAYDEHLEEYLQHGIKLEYEARNDIAERAVASLEEFQELGERTVAVLRRYADVIDGAMEQ